MLDLDPDISARLARQLKGLDDWFQEYSGDGLMGEELSPSDMGLSS